MTWLFDAATAVTSTDDPNVWHADLRDEFTIVRGHPNGGYLLAVLGQAALAAVGEKDRHVVASTVTYISPPTVGSVRVVTEVLRQGKTASQVRTQLIQADRLSVDAVLIVGNLGDEAPDFDNDCPPEMPSEDQCRSDSRSGRSPILGLETPPLASAVRMTFDPAVLGFLDAKPTGKGELRAWVSLADGRPWCPLSLLLAVDSLPPATFDVYFSGWVPTLSLTAYIRRAPAPGPLLVRFRANLITGGMVDETCVVWDSAGAVVAQATQLAAIRPPGK